MVVYKTYLAPVKGYYPGGKGATIIPKQILMAHSANFFVLSIGSSHSGFKLSAGAMRRTRRQSFLKASVPVSCINTTGMGL